MISNHNLGALMGAPVQGDHDDKIGTVGQIFVDPDSGNPNWITVHTGLFGRRQTFVPLHDANWDHEVLHVPFDKDTIKQAPRIDTDEALSPEHEADLYRYYRISTDGGDDDQGKKTDTHQQQNDDRQGDQDSGQATSQASGQETSQDSRQEAEQSQGTNASGPLRLRKYVVTENKEMTVPVEHEEVRVETEGDVRVDTSDAPDVDVAGEQRPGRHAKED